MRKPTLDELLEIYLRDEWFEAYSWEDFKKLKNDPRFEVEETDDE